MAVITPREGETTICAGVDLARILGQLSRVRPLFHSEADFQHALAWQLQLAHPDLRIRLERRPVAEVRQAADVWITDTAGDSLVLELKHLVRAVDATVAGERFVLANQAAHDISRYDVVKDLTRVEAWVGRGLAVRGAVIVVSNDPGYWRVSPRTTIDAAFRLHEGRTLHGELPWATNAGAGTTRGRTGPLHVRGTYPVAWQTYSEPVGAGELRTLILDTADSQPALPAVPAPAPAVHAASRVPAPVATVGPQPVAGSSSRGETTA
jgi:hypothetical protein